MGFDCCNYHFEISNIGRPNIIKLRQNGGHCSSRFFLNNFNFVHGQTSLLLYVIELRRIKSAVLKISIFNRKHPELFPFKMFSSSWFSMYSFFFNNKFDFAMSMQFS